MINRRARAHTYTHAIKDYLENVPFPKKGYSKKLQLRSDLTSYINKCLKYSIRALQKQMTSLKVINNKTLF